MPDEKSQRDLRKQIHSLKLENRRLRELVDAAVARHKDESFITPPNVDGWYRLLSQSINDVMWLRDTRLRLTYISPSVERLSGFTQKESLDIPIEKWLTPHSLKITLERLEEVLARPEGEPEPPIETEIICKDGSTRWVENQVTLLRSTAGKPVGLLGVSRDITERRRIGEELRRRNQVLESIFSNLRQIFFSLDVTNMTLLEVSPACESIYGLPREQFLADPMCWLRPVLQEDRKALHEGFEALRSGKKMESVSEYRIQKPDGEVLWMRSRIRRQETDGIVRLDGFVTDITENKRLESQLQQAQKMEAIGTLAGGIAHDMNNVLGVVMGLASVLAAQLPEADPKRKHVDGILAVSRQGRDLTRNLLGFARKGRFRREAVVLNHVVEEVISLLGRTIPKSILIRTRLDGALDAVEGDPGQLNHALMNLCLNACDAMENGGTLTISTRNVKLNHQQSGLSPGRYARLQVADTGTGMTPHEMSRAFEPFFTTKAKGRGTGLGLSMVYGTVANHGGDVTLGSEPGKGTTVTLLLPTIAQVAETTVTAGQSRPETAERRGTVLLVDDDEMFRFAAEQMLGELGFDVVAVGDGVSAIESYRDLLGKACMVLLDLQMPHMDGEQIFFRLKELDPQVPVLLCSGFSAEAQAEKLQDAGALGFLHKPFEIASLGVHMDRALRRHRRRQRNTP